MATRKKVKAAEETPEVHVCSQAAAIGGINARLDGQEATDERIEQALNKLVEDHNQARINDVEQFADIGKQIAKIGIVLEESVKSNKQLLTNQTQMIEQMNHFSSTAQLMKQGQDQFEKTVEDHIVASAKWQNQAEKRIHKLELCRYFWYTLGAVIIAILGALSYLATIVDTFNSSSKSETTIQSRSDDGTHQK